MFGCVGLGVAFGVSFAFSADWYAKDNLQPGHDPSMTRFEDGYALMGFAWPLLELPGAA